MGLLEPTELVKLVERVCQGQVKVGCFHHFHLWQEQESAMPCAGEAEVGRREAFRLSEAFKVKKKSKSG